MTGPVIRSFLELVFVSVLIDCVSVSATRGRISIDKIDIAISYMYPVSAAFFSGMLTSIWLWFYLLARMATCVTAKLDIAKKFAVKHADVKRDPLATLNFFIRMGIYGIAATLLLVLAVFEFLL